MFPENYTISKTNPWYDGDAMAVFRRRALYNVLRAFLAWRLATFGCSDECVEYECVD